MDEEVRPPFFTKPQEYVGSNNPRKTMFLDMDETLVYCFLGRPRFFDNHDENFYSFYLEEDADVEYCAFKRPGLDRFLHRCAEHYDLCILTAGDELYAKTLLRWLTPSIPEDRWFCRNYCAQSEGVCYKDLSRLPGPVFDPRITLIIDDSAPNNIVPRANGISIPRFAPQTGRPDEEIYERMRSDSVMESFGNMLCGPRFVRCSDVRVPIREYYDIVESWSRSSIS